MKQLFFIVMLLAASVGGYSQTCVIKIYYDDNGNRIFRQQECAARRPEPPKDTINSALQFSDDPLKNEDIRIGSFSVFPNPSSNLVNVTFDQVSLGSTCMVTLLDQLGKEHYRKTVEASTLTIPIGHLADGVYHLVVLRGSRKDVVKIAKESSAGNNR